MIKFLGFIPALIVLGVIIGLLILREIDSKAYLKYTIITSVVLSILALMWALGG